MSWLLTYSNPFQATGPSVFPWSIHQLSNWVRDRLQNGTACGRSARHLGVIRFKSVRQASHRQWNTIYSSCSSTASLRPFYCQYLLVKIEALPKCIFKHFKRHAWQMNANELNRLSSTRYIEHNWNGTFKHGQPYSNLMTTKPSCLNWIVQRRNDTPRESPRPLPCPDLEALGSAQLPYRNLVSHWAPWASASAKDA